MHRIMEITRPSALATALCTALLILGLAAQSQKVSASPLPQETVTLEEDQLAVTVASASKEQTDPLNSDLTIWVGEIELFGRDTIWVELIDSYGEVIYDSEVRPNETHLLPDGRAVVVRSVDPETRIVKSDESRLEIEGQMMVTRRIVEDGQESTSVEFVEAAPKKKSSPLLEMAAVGQTIWTTVLTFFDTAVTQVEVAWSWLVDTIRV
ncbi:hypothetical protein [Roseibium polysiphoniae]|uniref:hypothetical protein n=1 Tax=Roseibium polysiphoniae TaxID=2571221 RepID=UPI001FE8D1E1|nr:hypothetical protein [Roseibium polysiphoniae]